MITVVDIIPDLRSESLSCSTVNLASNKTQALLAVMACVAQSNPLHKRYRRAADGRDDMERGSHGSRWSVSLV
jgi:hypothetical protein